MNTLDQIRIVLIGRTGNGKSATGNSLLLARNAFKSLQSARSITTDCQMQIAQRKDSSGMTRPILVVDTPGFFDTDTSVTNEMVARNTASQIFEMTAPGVHAFLIILRIGRFSPEERNTVDLIRIIFGPNAASYCIVVFTHEEQLEGQHLDDFISSSPTLQELVNICGNRKFTINNKLIGEPSERKTQQLLGMIQEMVNANRGTYYTNAEYERIERQKREEKNRREEEERQKKEEHERKLKEEGAEAEKQRQNEVASVRTETRTREFAGEATPTMSTERKRKHGVKGLFSHNGSGYDYYEVQTGSRTTTICCEEQRQVTIFCSGRQESGEWVVTKQWTKTE